jgi:TolB-like protein
VRFEFGDYVLDVDRRELRRRDEPMTVEPQVFDLLLHLVQNRHRVVSKDDLIAAIWGGRIVSDSAVTTRINAVRRAVGDTGAAQAVIRTVTRKGVRFIAPVEEQGTEEPRLSSFPTFSPPSSVVRPSIVVLPFRNASGDPRQEYFTDAVTADLTVDLSRIRDIGVISAASAFAYKNSALDVRQIGREFGVRYLVTGGIARADGPVRTNIQLVDATSGFGAIASSMNSPISAVWQMPSPAVSPPRSISSWYGRKGVAPRGRASPTRLIFACARPVFFSAPSRPIVPSRRATCCASR